MPSLYVRTLRAYSTRVLYMRTIHMHANNGMPTCPLINVSSIHVVVHILMYTLL